MADVSRTTAKKLANSSAVVSAIEVQGARIAERAQAAVFGSSDGAPNFASLINQLGEQLRLAGTELRDFEAEYLAERTDNDAARAAREDADRQLRDAYIGIKSVVIAGFGERYAARVGLGTNVERRPDLLLAQARNAERLLNEVEPPEAQLTGATFDRVQLAASLGAAAEPLERALRDLDRELREDQHAMIRRDEAVEKWERVYVLTAETLVALATAAGEHALAARIRPTARRRAGIESPTDPSEPTEPVIDTPTEPTEPTGPAPVEA